eukprot:1836433-Amphidinium_carterae.1
MVKEHTQLKHSAKKPTGRKLDWLLDVLLTVDTIEQNPLPKPKEAISVIILNHYYIYCFVLCSPERLPIFY